MKNSIHEVFCFLKEIPLFESTEREDLETLAANLELIKLPCGTHFIQAGKAVESFYIIREGIAGIIVANEVVAERGKGDYLGEMAALFDEKASATVRTLTEMSLLQMPGRSFKSLISKESLMFLLYNVGENRKSLGLKLSETLLHSPQGLVKITPQGLITREISAKCIEYLGADNVFDLRDQSLVEILAQYNPSVNREWEVFPFLFEQEFPSMEFDMMVSLLPTEVWFPDKKNPDELKQFGLSYYPCLGANKKIVAMDIGMVDITSDKQLALIEKEEKVLKKIYVDPESYFDMLKLINEVQNKFEYLGSGLELKNKGTDFADSLKRDIHTLKGISGLYHIDDMQEVCHNIEGALGDFIKEPDSERVGQSSRFGKKFNEMLIKFQSETEKIERITSNISSELRARLEGIVISPKDIQKIKQAIRKNDITMVLEQITLIERIPLAKLMAAFETELMKQSEKIGKHVKLVCINADIRVPIPVYNELKVLIHMVRNALDHGIEGSEDRELAGKDTCGIIKFAFNMVDNGINIEVEDDGKGIDVELLREKARRENIAENVNELGAEEVLDLVFHPSFSSKEEVTQLSGRGVGLNAVKETITTTLNGKVKVKTELGKGTKFLIDIPCFEILA